MDYLAESLFDELCEPPHIAQSGQHVSVVGRNRFRIVRGPYLPR